MGGWIDLVHDRSGNKYNIFILCSRHSNQISIGGESVDLIEVELP
jgi:hypothetical protein